MSDQDAGSSAHVEDVQVAISGARSVKQPTFRVVLQADGGISCTCDSRVEPLYVKSRYCQERESDRDQNHVKCRLFRGYGE